jgi:hypothetical protein
MMNYQISSFHPLFWGALQRQKNELQKIIYEIRNFCFNQKEIEQITNATIQHFTREEAEKIILRSYFANRTGDVRISIITLASFYIEGLFNEYLAIKSGNEYDFNKIISKKTKNGSLRKMSFLERVTDAPKHFCKDYEIPDKLLIQLKELIQRRNYFAHNEPEITSNGNIIFGKKQLSMNDGYKKLFEWTELPRLLHENLLSYERAEAMDSTSILISDYRYDLNEYIKESHLEEISNRYLRD